MKKIAIVLFIAFFLSGCESSTQYGQCVGVTDDKDSALLYKISTQNLIVGLLFFEMIIPPVVVLATEWQCPVAKKQQKVGT